jgi:tRNA(adenine34) deaminase
MDHHHHWMHQALAQAAQAGQAGDIPVGAILLNPQGQPIAQTQNRRDRDQDPLGHAELLALRAGAQHLNNWRLTDCTLYVTLEPCPMCAAAILQARIKTLIYGTEDLKAGAIRSVLNLPDSPASFHKLTIIGGILETDARLQLQTWFKQRRNANPPVNNPHILNNPVAQ